MVARLAANRAKVRPDVICYVCKRERPADKLEGRKCADRESCLRETAKLSGRRLTKAQARGSRSACDRRVRDTGDAGHERMSTVAALYVDPAGAYANLPGVEVWDEARDARLYDGPYPVVAHPPCARWSIMGACRGYRDGDDGGCFAAALEAVRTFGGVLEHPRYSLAWPTFGLPRPARYGWTASLDVPGWTAEVDQRWYGLEWRKPTWLYVVGAEPPPLIWHTAPRSHLSVGRIGGQGRSHVRARTPPAFRDVLLAMARSVARERDALAV